jgi:hypothetical protein
LPDLLVERHPVKQFLDFGSDVGAIKKGALQYGGPKSRGHHSRH